ncbi:MAG: glycosyltransferase family 4 protein [Desulfobacteraceae bacterium]|nr:glycosyltransferase family 4 protein [Desulfobacteraceae bacterium]
MIHVAIDGKRFFMNTSGLGRYSRTLIKGLMDDRYGEQIRITLFRPKGKVRFDAPDHAGLHIETAAYRLPGDLGNGLWRFRKLPKIVDRGQFSLFHGPSHVLPVSAKTPMVVTMFDLIFLRYPQYFKKWDRAYYQFAFRKSAERADHIISFSMATKADLVNYFNIDDNKITVVYPGFDEDFRPLPEKELITLKNHHTLPEEYILYVGTIEPRKNILKTATAFDRLLSAGEIPDNYQFLIVGSKGWFYDDIISGIQKLKHSDKIRLAGPVFGRDLAGIYQLARMTAYPSLFEGFGYPVLESLRVGTPVLTSNISSLPEAGGDAAVLVDPASTDEIASGIKKLVTDEALRAQCIERGYEHAARFSPENMAAGTMKVYRRISGRA